MNQAFIVTEEHRCFAEFANAVRNEKTIEICHGAAVVGKTNSARRYANGDALEAYGLRDSSTVRCPMAHTNSADHCLLANDACTSSVLR